MPVVPAPAGAALAIAGDLETLLQRTFTEPEAAAADLLLVLASAAIRSYTGQEFTLTTTTARLKVRGNKVRLPQAPVSAVSAVTSVDAAVLSFTWYGGPQVTVSAPGSSFDVDAAYGCHTYVDVTYTHGYATVPDDIRAVVLQVAGRAFGTAADQTGVQSESIGSYSYSVGGAAASGAVGLLAGERAILDRYRLPASPIVMERV